MNCQRVTLKIKNRQRHSKYFRRSSIKNKQFLQEIVIITDTNTVRFEMSNEVSLLQQTLADDLLQGIWRQWAFEIF